MSRSNPRSIARKYSRKNRYLRPRLEQLESRTVPAALSTVPPLDWSTATGTDSASTLNVSALAEMGNVMDRLAPIVAADGATLAPTGIPELYAATGPRDVLSQLYYALSSQPFVRYVEPERTEQIALSPNDPDFTNGNLYGMNGTHGINAPSAWDATVGNTRVTVADIDTGMDYNHPDLYENVWINQAEIPASRKSNLIDVDGDGRITFYDLNDARNQGPYKITDVNGDGRIDAADILAPMQTTGGLDNGLGGWADGKSEDGDTAHVDDLIGWNFVANTNNPFDDNDHGTHTAGTIGAIGNNGVGVVGVDWTAQIMPLKFLNSSGSGSDTNAALAIRYAADHGARVSNNSWGGSGMSTTTANAIDYAASKGDVFVAAAGNSSANDDTTFFFPASYHKANMIVVAATDSNGNLASFSNYGAATVDLGAPGVSILSTVRTSDSSPYAFFSGTSMATPHVTGTVALILSQHPTWSYSQIVQQIKSTVTANSALAGITTTGGNLNAGVAVDHDIWNGYAHDPERTADSVVPSQPLQQIHWQTPVDLHPQYSGNDLFIHYGTPITTQANTLIVPVKTGTTDGFELQGINAATGAVKWTQTTDYSLPGHNWTPSYSPTLAPNGILYFAGAGGTIYSMSNPDISGTPTVTQLAFYGLSSYQGNTSTYNSNVHIDTPITADAAGNIYFGFVVTGSTPTNLASGLARISASGAGSWVSANTLAGGNNITKVAYNDAPALSNDGQYVYVAVNDGNGTSDSNFGFLVRALSSTLQETNLVRLKDAKIPANDASVPDDGSASVTIGPDGDVYYGVLENDGQYASKGWMLHFSADLYTTKTPGSFGWDDTASIVDRSLVPSYTGSSSYLLLTKYNNYADFGLDGINKIAILDPNATQVDPRTGATVMKEVLTIAGPTPDPNFTGSHPNAVREWCINSAVIDPFTDSVLANSEDGKLYRWSLATNTFTEAITLTPGVGEAYTPTVIGKDGTVYAINNATLFAVGLDPNLTAVVVDDSTFGYGETGQGWQSWPTGYGFSLRYNNAAWTNGASASWQASGLHAGNFVVQATWNGSPNHTSAAVYNIYDNNTLVATVSADQRQTPAGGVVGTVPFQTLATVPITSDTLRVVVSTTTAGDLVADAVRIVTAPPVVDDLSWSGVTGPTAATTGTPFTMSRTYSILNPLPGGTANAFTISYYASPDSSFTNLTLLGSETVPAGQVTGTYSGNSPPLQITTAGTYYLLARLDSGSAILETNEGNNAAQAPQQVTVTTGAPALPLILDNGQPGYAENGAGWTSYALGYNGNLRYDSSAWTNGAAASWQLTNLASGAYTVQATWNAGSNHTSAAVYQIYDGNTLVATATADQRQNPSGVSFGGAPFQTLATVNVSSGTLTVVVSTTAAGDLVADAVRFSAAAAPTVDLNWTGGGISGPASAVTATPFTISRSYTIANSVNGGTTPNAFTIGYYASTQNDFGSAFLLGTETIPAGQAAGTYSGSSPQFQFFTPGAYYLFARLDDGAALQETDESNNTVEAPQPVPVTQGLPVIVDNGQSPGYAETGSGWTGYAIGYNGTVRYNSSAASSGATASWQVTGLTSGTFSVQATWNGSPVHTGDAVYSVYDGNTLLATVHVDQRQDPSGTSFGGVPFQKLATVNVTSGTLKVVLTAAAAGDVVADAVRVAASPAPAVDVNWTGGGISGPTTTSTGTSFTISRTYTIAGGATPNAVAIGYYASADGTFTNATFLGREYIPEGQGAGTYSGNSPSLQFSAVGTYYLLARLDDGNALAETNENNNTIQAPQQVTVMQGVPTFVDNGDPGYSETGSGWTSYPLGYNGTVRYNSSAWSSGATAIWTVPSLASGSYTVQADWNGAPNHTPAAVYSIYDGNTLLTTVSVDQTQASSGSVFGAWHFQTLATVTISSGTLRVVLSTTTAGDVVADAIRVS